MEMAGKMSGIDRQGASRHEDARDLRNATGEQCSPPVEVNSKSDELPEHVPLSGHERVERTSDRMQPARSAEPKWYQPLRAGHGARFRRFAASLFVFAALGTGPAGAARIEVWTATLTPTDVSGDLGCHNASGNSAVACSTATVLSDDDFTYDSTDYAVIALFLTSSGHLTLDLDTDITTATKGLTLVVSGTSLAFADATAAFDRQRVWTSTGLSWTAGTAVGVKLISTNTEPTAANGTVTTGANTEYRFAYADFNYRDADRDRLSSGENRDAARHGQGHAEARQREHERGRYGDAGRARHREIHIRPALERERERLCELHLQGE